MELLIDDMARYDPWQRKFSTKLEKSVELKTLSQYQEFSIQWLLSVERKEMYLLNMCHIKCYIKQTDAEGAFSEQVWQL